MIRRVVLAVALALLLALPARAQQAPQYETRKVADNVYVFRYVGHQSMFVVTPKGVMTGVAGFTGTGGLPVGPNCVC